MTAPSPGILTRFVVDAYYQDEAAYGRTRRRDAHTEYQANASAPDSLCRSTAPISRLVPAQPVPAPQRRTSSAASPTATSPRSTAATEGLPADRMRLHICWGNYEEPHTHDIRSPTSIDHRAEGPGRRGSSIEAANPATSTEWEDLKAIRIPDDKVLIPGVLDLDQQCSSSTRGARSPSASCASPISSGASR